MNGQQHQVGRLTTGQCATLACLLEVTAPKVGNVHRGADFQDLTFTDFVISATAIGPAMDRAVTRGVGATVQSALESTRQLVATNTNLGIVLLLAPLAAVPRQDTLEDGLGQVLRDMTPGDAQAVYEAIRRARPGGLGRAPQMDVHGQPPADLRKAMQLASKWDLVAQQYADDFAEVRHLVVPWLLEGQQQGWNLIDSIVHAHLRLLSRFADSLIVRKCGPVVAEQASRRAEAVLQAGRPGDSAYLRQLAELDFWLRSDHRRRNPGTTADLITAGLFAVLRDEKIPFPLT